MASRNQNLNEPVNPCKKFFKWETIKETVVVDKEEFVKVKGGQWVYFDKDAPNPEGKNGKGKNFPMSLPFKFAVLNPDMVCWKGYDKPNKASVWSNEVVQNKDNDLFNPNARVEVIHSQQKELLNFTISEYQDKFKKIDIKKSLKDANAKYTQSVYICFQNEQGEWELGNLQLSGGSLTGAQREGEDEDFNDGWFAYCGQHKKNLLFKYMVEVNDFKVRKKEDGGKFTIPVYSQGQEVSEKDNVILSQFDKELTQYLKDYLKKGKKAELVAVEDEGEDSGSFLED